MAYQNDLSTLADVVSPVDAAVQAGIQNRQSNESENLANQLKAGTLQADIAKPGLANVFQQAQNQKAQMENDATAATQPGAIAATNAGNQTKVGADQIAKVGQLGQLAGQLAGYMDQIPEASRPAAMQEFMQKQGIDPSKLGALVDGNPDNLRSFSTKMNQMSANYQTELMKENQNTARSTAVAGIQSDSRRDVANAQIEGKLAAENVKAKAREALAPLGALQREIYAKVANGTATPAERATLDSINKTQQLVRSGQPLAASITGTDVQSNVPGVPDTTPGGQGDAPVNYTPAQGGGAASTGGNAPSPSDIEAEMRRRKLIK